MTHEASLSIPLGDVTLEARLARGPGGPAPGASAPDTPAPGASALGAPVPGTPAPGASALGAPVPGTPAPGASASGAPAGEPPSGALWILGHPHPEYGGTMDNAVVLAARDAILASASAGPGAATLRWNSRGVGRSTGYFGLGEAEAADLAALTGPLMGRSASGRGDALPPELSGPFSSIGLAGYSFGAFVVLRAIALGALGAPGALGALGAHSALGAFAQGTRPGAVMLFSPPLDFMSFEGLVPPGLPCLVTLGDRDAFCRRSSLEAWLATSTSAPAPQVRILRGVDHFYLGAERALAEAVRGFLSSLPG